MFPSVLNAISKEEILEKALELQKNWPILAVVDKHFYCILWFMNVLSDLNKINVMSSSKEFKFFQMIQIQKSSL